MNHVPLLERADVPTIVASAHELEGFISAVHDRPDAGARMLDAVHQTEPHPPLHAAVKDLAVRPNPLLDDAWRRFT